MITFLWPSRFQRSSSSIRLIRGSAANRVSSTEYGAQITFGAPYFGRTDHLACQLPRLAAQLDTTELARMFLRSCLSPGPLPMGVRFTTQYIRNSVGAAVWLLR